MSKVKVFGLDVAKNEFQVAGLAGGERKVVSRRLRRAQLLSWFDRQPRALVALEPCPGSHFWARALRSMGFAVKMIPAQETRNYRSGRHKNDARDAVAIARAALSDQVASVAVKSEEQLQIQALYKSRSLVMKQRDAVASQMRAQLLEFGVALARSAGALRRGVEQALEDEQLPRLFRDEVLAWSYRHYRQLDERVRELNRQIRAMVRQSALGRSLVQEPGIGPVTAAYLVGVMGGPGCARSGRGFSARIGLVPCQSSSAERHRLGKITKLGDRTARALFLQGGNTLLRHPKASPVAEWGAQVARRRGANRAKVAIANKLARRAWAVMNRHAQGCAEVAA